MTICCHHRIRHHFERDWTQQFIGQVRGACRVGAINHDPCKTLDARGGILPASPHLYLLTASAVIVRHQDLRQPPALTKMPPGHMDAANLQDIGQWIKETDEKKNAYVAAVDTPEIKINGQTRYSSRTRRFSVASPIILIS